MTDVFDGIADLLVPDDEPPATQENAPAPRRGRGRPRKDETVQVNIKPSARGSASTSVPMPDAGVIANQMSQLYTIAAIPLMLAKPKTAEAITENADAIGKAWEKVAQSNPKVRAALLGLAGASTWGGLAFAHMPIVFALMNEGTPSGTENADAVGAGPSTGRHAASGPANPVGAVLASLRLATG